jgi:hypothetical protein
LKQLHSSVRLDHPHFRLNAGHFSMPSFNRVVRPKPPGSRYVLAVQKSGQMAQIDTSGTPGRKTEMQQAKGCVRFVALLSAMIRINGASLTDERAIVRDFLCLEHLDLFFPFGNPQIQSCIGFTVL